MTALSDNLPATRGEQLTANQALALLMTETKGEALRLLLEGVLSARTPGGLQALSATLTRPANTTAYAQYDLVADSTSAAAATPILNAVRAAGECFRWEGARLRTPNPAAKGKTFRLHLWRTLPTLTVQDNGIFNPTGAGVLTVSDIAGYVGYVDVTLTEAGVAGASGRGDLAGARTATPSSGTSLWVTVEQRDAAGYTPVSAEAFSIVLEGQWS